ncbi:MAG: 50S ribosomal protein L35 [bacterium]|nr:50S ribosomal protein L35 [bacterium]
MPKVKTNRAAAKRFTVTAGGKIKAKKSYARHILTKKSRKRKRKLREATYLSASDARAVRRLIPYK